MWKWLKEAIARLFVWIVRGYQLVVSPYLPPACRFTPTCSQYAIDALKRRGPFTGFALTLWRLLRCHPLHPGGYDPVDKSRN